MHQCFPTSGKVPKRLRPRDRKFLHAYKGRGGGMALNQYIVRTDGLFGIALDSDVVALRRSYVNSQLGQIIYGLKVLDSNVPLNVESLDRANELFKEVKPMLHWPECDQFLKAQAVRLHETYLTQRKDIVKRKTTDPLTQSSSKPASNTPPLKPPPPKPASHIKPLDLPRVPFHIPYVHPQENAYSIPPPPPPPPASNAYFVPPPPPPPPPPAKTAQNVVAPKTEPSVPAPLKFDSELKAKLAIIRDAVDGTDSSSVGRVFKPQVITQGHTPPVKMMGQDISTSRHQSPAIVHEEQNWSDSESD